MTMSEHTLITSTKASEKTVHRMLMVPHTLIALGVRLLPSGEIVLVQLSTAEEVYLFDVRQDPKIIHEGQLWRILESPDITKVMHDCRHASAAIKRQFSVSLRNVFDTQAAHAMIMTHRALPPRQINVHELYECYGEPEQRLAPLIKSCVEINGHFWSQRPLSQEMCKVASLDVQCLLPAVYENLTRAMNDLALEKHPGH